MKREIIPSPVRLAVREAMGGWGPYTLREIRDKFEAHGFSVPAGVDWDAEGGQRRGAVATYQRHIHWDSSEECERYLVLIEEVLDDYPEEAPPKKKLLAALKRAQIGVDSGRRLRLPAVAILAMDAAGLSEESGIRLQANRLARLDATHEELVGAAKELVEATNKHVLLTLQEPFDGKADVATLTKSALTKLRLHPDAVAPTTQGAETIRRMLGGLTQIAAGLAELRNEGYGVGHGQARRLKGLRKRHGEFAARAAVTYATFLLDTLHDPDAPWNADQPPRVIGHREISYHGDERGDVIEIIVGHESQARYFLKLWPGGGRCNGHQHPSHVAALACSDRWRIADT